MNTCTGIIGERFWNAQQQFGIDPLVLGLLYFCTIPLFIAAMAWMTRNVQTKKQVILPAGLSIISCIAAYVYLAAVGTVIPAWICLVVAAAIAIAIGSAWAAMQYRLPQLGRRRLPRRRGGV